jgi:hypothetical protein
MSYANERLEIRGNNWNDAPGANPPMETICPVCGVGIYKHEQRRVTIGGVKYFVHVECVSKANSKAIWPKYLYKMWRRLL